MTASYILCSLFFSFACFLLKRLLAISMSFFLFCSYSSHSSSVSFSFSVPLFNISIRRFSFHAFDWLVSCARFLLLFNIVRSHLDADSFTNFFFTIYTFFFYFDCFICGKNVQFYNVLNWWEGWLDWEPSNSFFFFFCRKTFQSFGIILSSIWNHIQTDN